MDCDYYVYILQSTTSPDRFYTGITQNLAARLLDHNTKGGHHTSKYQPWTLKSYVAFGDKTRALRFETYLKSGSGRAFAIKRL
jgi:predicted GIY-YIG superfamily endonuclease